MNTMKKITVAVTAFVLALSLATPAMAAMQITGMLEGGYAIRTGDAAQLNPEQDGRFYISAQENGWHAEAEIKDLTEAAKFGPYKVEFVDPNFQLRAWGKGKVLNGMKDPMGFIESKGKHNGTLKTRLGVGPVVVDLQDDGQGFLFAEQQIQNHTLGVVAHSRLPVKDNGVTVLGYGRTNLANIALDAEVGITRAQDVTEKNIGYGVKAVAPITSDLLATVSYKARPENFAVTSDQGVNELFAEAKYDGANIQLAGSMTDKKGAANNRTWKAQAELAAIEIEASTSRDTTDADDHPTNMVAVAHGRQINPVFAANGRVELKSDLDGVTYKQKSLHNVDGMPYFDTTGYAKVQLDGKYTGIAKLAIEPSLTYVMGRQVDDEARGYLRFGSKAAYQISPNGRLTAEYGRDHVNGVFNDSIVAAGYEVKF